MLDIKFILENKEAVRKNCESRGIKCDIDKLLDLYEKRKKIGTEFDRLQSEKNKINDYIIKATAEEKSAIIKKGRDIKEKYIKIGGELKGVSIEYLKLLHQVPNMHSEDTPIGKDESFNKPKKEIGNIPKFDFQLKDHIELGEKLDIIDTQHAAIVSGSRFSYLKNEAALLEFALVQYALAILTDEKLIKKIAKNAKLRIDTKAFIPVIPPVLVKEETLEKMGRLEPKEERYFFPTDNLYLVGSAEHSLGPLHMNEIIKEEKLPIRYVGFSTAFRREAGSYGKDVRGILRVHQFDKLEIMSFSLPENSIEEQNFIVALQEYLVNSLGLPYRVMAICTGDMGNPDYRQIDIETWMPGQNKYRETHTSDCNTDYQARRLNTKLRRKDGKLEFVHTNDATAIAIGRTLIAILENYQQKDGSVEIPKVLQKYLPKGMKKINPKK